MSIVRTNGTLSVDTDHGVVRFRDQHGVCTFTLEGCGLIKTPRRIHEVLERHINRKPSDRDKGQVRSLFKRGKSVKEISRLIRLEGRRVSGIVSNSLRRGIL